MNSISIETMFRYSRVISCSDEKYNIFKKRFEYFGLPIPRRFNGIQLEKTVHSTYYKILDFTVPHSMIIGITVSHIANVIVAKELNLPFIAIFEDDAFPCNDVIDKLKYYISDIPDDCGVLQLGYNKDFQNTTYLNLLNNKYYSTKKCHGGQSYIVFKQAYDKVLEAYTKCFISDVWWEHLDKFTHLVTKEPLFAQKTFNDSNDCTPNSFIAPLSQMNLFDQKCVD